MASVQLSGLQSGIDTQSIISQLVAVEQKRLTMYQDKQEKLEEKQTAIGEVKTKMNNLLTAVENLSDAGELRTYTTSSSDGDIVTAKATSSAYEGSHTIVINQLANSERWVSSTGETNTEDCVGAGTFIYSYNNQETAVTTSDTTTLEGLVTLINNDANNPGVTASLLSYGGIYHLILNGNEAGSDNKISINASNTEVWEAESLLTKKDGTNASESTKLTDLYQFTGSLSGGETITISGYDHDGTEILNTFNFTSSTKISTFISEINEAFDGEGGAVARFEDGKIILTDTVCGTSSLSVNLTCSSTAFTLPTMARSTEGGIVTARTDNYSSLNFTRTQQALDSQIRVDGYPPDGQWLERSANTISDAIDGVTLNLQNTTDAAGERITLTRDTEDLETKVASFVSAYNTLIELIKKHTDYDEDTKTAGVLLSDYTVASIQQQVRLPLLTQAKGFVQGTDSYLSALNIGFSIDSDGTLEFDSEKFSDAVSDDYAGVLAVLGAQKTGSTNSRTISFYGSSNDNTTAGQYDVDVSVADGVITSAKIKLSSESVWRDMNWNPGSNIITGITTYDDNGNPDYPEHSLQLSVNVPASGTYSYTATVNVKQGFAGAMEDVLDKILDTTSGSLTIDKESVSDQIDAIEDKIADEEDRLTTYQERLTAKYARLEATLSLLQQQMSVLTGSSS